MGFLVVSLLLMTGLATDDGFVARARAADEARVALNASVGAEERGRNVLRWVQAMGAALEAIPIRWNDKREPYRSWIDAHADEVVWHEPGADWLIRVDRIWALHATVAKTASAEAIAWLAVKTSVPGECEGTISCELEWFDQLDGEYLRRHPTGAHEPEAIGRLSTSLTRIADSVGDPNLFEPARECVWVREHLEPLRVAVDGTTHPERAVLRAKIEQIARACPRP